jgi:hypothetical protein
MVELFLSLFNCIDLFWQGTQNIKINLKLCALRVLCGLLDARMGDEERVLR